jgi:hypothetical protein
MVETEFPEFTDKELQIFREGFLKFDTDHNGFLQVFELHMMYESIGETKVREQAHYRFCFFFVSGFPHPTVCVCVLKTNAELLKLIAEAGHEAQNRQSLCTVTSLRYSEFISELKIFETKRERERERPQSK